MSSGVIELLFLPAAVIGLPVWIALSVVEARQVDQIRARMQSLQQLFASQTPRDARLQAQWAKLQQRLARMEEKLLHTRWDKTFDVNQFDEELHQLEDQVHAVLAQDQTLRRLYEQRLARLALLVQNLGEEGQALYQRAQKMDLGYDQVWGQVVHEYRQLLGQKRRAARRPRTAASLQDDLSGLDAAAQEQLWRALGLAPAGARNQADLEEDARQAKLRDLRQQIEALTPLLTAQELTELRSIQDPDALQQAVQAAWQRWHQLLHRYRRIQTQYQGLSRTEAALAQMARAYHQGDYRRLEHLVQAFEAQEQDPTFQREYLTEKYLQHYLPGYRIQWQNQGFWVEGDGAQAVVWSDGQRLYVNAHTETPAFCRRMETMAEESGGVWIGRDTGQGQTRHQTH
ncbi:MAG: hypothetical protein GXO36_01390 [Chloroflexi bacterium]|nr:hypothetical protein [Chloroflexota bacterium]